MVSSRRTTLRVLAFLEYVDKALAEVLDFIEYPVLVQVFIEFVYWALWKFAIAPGLHEGRGEMAMAAAPRCFFLLSTSDSVPFGLCAATVQ